MRRCGRSGRDGDERDREREREVGSLIYRSNTSFFVRITLSHSYDEELGDIPSQHSDLVADLVRVMEDHILDHESSLIHTSSAISDLDATISLARVATEFDFSRPEVRL